MANISSYLAAIMSAVYGEDVRGSIHDAIEIINDVSEVVMTTGTAVDSPTSSSTGFYDGSFYINTTTMELWKCIGTNSWQSQGILKGADGADGNGIASIQKTGTVGLVDTYTITFDDGSTETYEVTNGQNGSKWYKGTAITGTGSSITGFPGVKDDYYLNSNTGMVYVCTRTGGASVPDPAEWDYVMTLTGGGGGSSVTVIDNLTSTSSTDALSANQGRVLKGLVDGKQATLTFDTTPTQNSTNPVQSGGIYTALQSKADASSVPSDLDDLSDVTITSPANDQVLKYNGSKWVNGTAPASGHVVIPTPASSVDEDDVVNAINGVLGGSNPGANDNVISAYGVGVWANTDTITLLTTVAQGDDTVGTWEDDATWESGSRAYWLKHTALHGILSDDDIEISLVFDVAGGEAVSCNAYRIDDAISSTLGGIAIKFNAPIQNAGGATVGVVLKRSRTNTETVPRTS